MKLSIFRTVSQRAARPERPDVERGCQQAVERIRIACMQQLGTQSMLIGICGAAGGEGSTLVSTALARSFASQPDCRVIHADMRIDLCAPPTTTGLATWLTGGGELASHLTTVDGCLRLAAGSSNAPIRPAAWDRLTPALRKLADVAICQLDAPTTSTNSLYPASLLDGVILLVEAGVTRWQVATLARQQLEEAQVHLLGMVLNKRRYVIPDCIYRLL